MDCSTSTSKQLKLCADIVNFVERARGLSVLAQCESSIRIQQAADRKFIDIQVSLLDDILFRTDTEGREFIQVNFISGLKILVTETLIGFKPTPPKGLDVGRLPKVVTTPDVISVFEAIQDAIHVVTPDESEVHVLKRIFEAVLSGAEAVGFDLREERSWVARIPTRFTSVAS